MVYIKVRFVQVGMDIETRIEEKGKIYFNDNGIKYEAQMEGGVVLSREQLHKTFIKSIPSLRNMTRPSLEVRVQVE